MNASATLDRLRRQLDDTRTPKKQASLGSKDGSDLILVSLANPHAYSIRVEGDPAIQRYVRSTQFRNILARPFQEWNVSVVDVDWSGIILAPDVPRLGETRVRTWIQDATRQGIAAHVFVPLKSSHSSRAALWARLEDLSEHAVAALETPSSAPQALVDPILQDCGPSRSSPAGYY